MTISKVFAVVGVAAFLLTAAVDSRAQSLKKSLNVAAGGTLQVSNLFGRVDIRTASEDEKISQEIIADASDGVVDGEIRVAAVKGGTAIDIAPSGSGKRIDVRIVLPARSAVKIRTRDGEIRISGDFLSVAAETETGSIVADVPLDDCRYEFLWTASRPRFVSDVELAAVKEKSAGRFAIAGNLSKSTRKSSFGESRARPEDLDENPESISEDEPREKDQKKSRDRRDATSVRLQFTTARGIILLNVPPNEVPSDLRERPLTNAAKAIVRSGDSLLVEAIRRASPKYFGDFAKTLPQVKMEPSLALRENRSVNPQSGVKRVLVRVTDINNRAVADLKADDFEISERGSVRDIVSVEPTTAPFNLVLLLDVSGSIEHYVDFIRKAARAFVQTADKDDRIAIIIFNEDVKEVSKFSTDRGRLSESLDTFDAGGATAYYDSLGFVLADTLRPLRGERSAIVVLTDGDDNHSFLSFDALAGSIQESGALIYPLYVPSALIAASNADLNAKIDPLRAKYMGLSTKAEGEGERLAQISGGVYYPITELSQIQKAYDDIVLQLRTAYSVTFRSDLPQSSDKTTASPRLKVKIRREGAFVKLGSVSAVDGK